MHDQAPGLLSLLLVIIIMVNGFALLVGGTKAIPKVHWWIFSHILCGIRNGLIRLGSIFKK